MMYDKHCDFSVRSDSFIFDLTNNDKSHVKPVAASPANDVKIIIY